MTIPLALIVIVLSLSPVDSDARTGPARPINRSNLQPRLIPPRSALELPVSHHLKIHSADQLGPVCLCGFHVGTSLLQSARV